MNVCYSSHDAESLSDTSRSLSHTQYLKFLRLLCGRTPPAGASVVQLGAANRSYDQSCHFLHRAFDELYVFSLKVIAGTSRELCVIVICVRLDVTGQSLQRGKSRLPRLPTVQHGR